VHIGQVIDSDKLLVMEAGKVLEFGHPAALLANKDSNLSKLVGSLGEAAAARLTEKARVVRHTHE
jgi:ABC-type multidrug transport system fused ATPase/permease subunit